jgi:hypothetical protein
MDFIKRILRRYHEHEDDQSFDPVTVGLRTDFGLKYYRPYLFPNNRYSDTRYMSDADIADMHDRQTASADREAAHVLEHGPSIPVLWDPPALPI